MQFSIVIPTLNRAEKLRHAISSALAQDFPDFEVLVSNNSSTDHTADMLRQMASPRLRSVCTERKLSMPDHWEFATRQARGEWVLILCDDDAIFPNALTHLSRLIETRSHVELIHYGQLIYMYDDGIAEQGNYVDVPHQVPLHVQQIDSRRKLRSTFWRVGFNLPKMLNSAAHRNLLSRIRERHGQVFSDWAPDFSSGMKLLANTSSYLRVGPLMLWGANLESYGAGAWRDPNHLLSFLKQFSKFDGTLSDTPYPHAITVYNMACDTLWKVRKELGECGRELQIDPVQYRRFLQRDLKMYVDLGFDQFRDLLHTVRLDLLRQRMRQTLLPTGPARLALSRLSGIGELAHRALIKTLAHRAAGKKSRERFSNIAEAAAAVSRRVIWNEPSSATPKIVPLASCLLYQNGGRGR